MATVLDSLLTLAGALLVYFCSPNPRWLSRALPARPWRWLGWALLLLAALAWVDHTSMRSGLFVLFTLLMLVLGLLPFASLLWRREDR